MKSLSYGQVLAYVGNKIGLSPNSPRLRDLVYEAVETLIEESDESLFKRHACLFARNGMVALPPDVLSVEWASYSGQRMPILKRSMEFMEGVGQADSRGWSRMTLLDDGWSPVWFDPPENAESAAVISSSPLDGGLQVRVVTRSSFGLENVLQIPISVEGGTPQKRPLDAMISTVTLPSGLHGELTFVVFDRDDTLWLLAKYDGRSVTPTFRRYRVLGLPTDDGPEDYHAVYCLVRMGYIDPTSDDDLCPIPSRSALLLMVQSLLLSERGLQQQAAESKALALSRMRTMMLAARGGGVGARIDSVHGLHTRDYDLYS